MKRLNTEVAEEAPPEGGTPEPMYKKLHAFYWIAPCLLYLWAVAGAPHVKGPNLWPPPDAEEYALLALRLIHGQAPLIGIGVHDYPSRYSLAFPALLAPAAALLGGEAARLWLAAALFGLAATALMARTGAWLLGSRAAGALAAAFFALHPQTAVAGTTLMGETAIVMMFFVMLELARPWLTGSADVPVRSECGIQNVLRAAVLGLVLGWLTLAKAPFAWWAAALAALAAARGFARRAWGPPAALIGAGLACAAADAFYRHWAFGSWGMNGYKFWAPAFYQEFLKTFNISYLGHSYSTLGPSGNLVYYGRMLLGLSNEFYGRYMAPVAAAGAAGLVLGWWRRKKEERAESRTPNSMVLPLMAGWCAVGAAFCGFYFFQEARFPYLWIPLADLAAAAALVRGPEWIGGLAKPWGRERIVVRAVRIGALLAALLILRGEYRRVRDVIHRDPGGDVAAPVAALRPLLARVPADAWLFSNYKPLTVELARANPGPTGSLYVTWLDGPWPLLNMHALGIDAQGLKPRRRRPGVAELQKIPNSWENRQAELIGLNGEWSLTQEERREFFRRPIYALIVRPARPPDTGKYLDETILPRLSEAVKMEVIGETGTAEGKATLYRAKP